jgi:hypothetical protein
MIGPGTDGETAVQKRQRPYDYGRKSMPPCISSLYADYDLASMIGPGTDGETAVAN